MKKKIALNVFYNLLLIISICGIFGTFQNQNYLFTALFVATGAFALYVKIQLIKDIRSTLKNKEKDL
jgi:hypothetical protein